MVGISIKHIRHSLVFKVILSVSFILLISISIWSIFHLRYFRKEVMRDMVEDSAKLSKMIKLGTHYAMMFNARDGINQIVKNIGKFEDIKHIRIYNKTGQIKFSNLSEEVGHKTSIKDEACFICHQSEPPLSELELIKRQRIFFAPDGLRLLGIISPIYNEPGCSTASCHAHQDDKKVLGALDLVMSLAETDREIEVFQNWHIALAAFIFVMTATIIFWVLLKFFIDPIQNVIKGTQLIAKGNYTALHDFNQRDEIGYLANAIDKMGEEIGKKQLDLNKQKDEYQKLFELVPCIITVQDRIF